LSIKRKNSGKKSAAIATVFVLPDFDLFFFSKAFIALNTIGTVTQGVTIAVKRSSNGIRNASSGIMSVICFLLLYLIAKVSYSQVTFCFLAKGE
jgi:hypothetical protein